MDNPTLRSEGQGRTTLVLIHGFPLDATLWARQRELSAEVRLLTFDLPGFGAAASLPAPHTLGELAEHVRQLLDAQQVARAVLCGLSMGGYILLECWRRFPQRIAGVVLADTRAEADAEEGRRNRDAAIAQIAAGARAAVTEGMLPKLLAAASRDDAELLAAVRAMMARASDQGLSAALAAMRDRPDARATLGTIDVPALALVGREDQLTPPAVMRVLASGIPGCELVELDAAGHLAPLENPRGFNDALRSWLTRWP